MCSAGVNAFAYMEMWTHADRHTVCILAECYGPKTGGYWFVCMFMISAIAVLSYLSIWIIVRRRLQLVRLGNSKIVRVK